MTSKFTISLSGLFILILCLPINGDLDEPKVKDIAQIKAIAQVEAIAMEFYQESDKLNFKHLRKFFHEELRIAYYRDDKLMVVPEEIYFALIKNDKAGCPDRQAQVLSVNINGKIAIVKMDVNDKVNRFHDRLTFINTRGQWKLIYNSPHLYQTSPKTAAVE